MHFSSSSLWLVLVLVLLVSASSSNQQDAQALLEFKGNLNNTRLADWNEANISRVCEWTGITCAFSQDDQQHHVVSIRLIFDYSSSSNVISTTMSPSLGNLTHLEELDLSGNYAFEELDLSGGIHGTIPPELGNCKRLRVLNLADTAINGTISPQLGQLQLLEELDLSGNYEIDGTIPPELGNCKRLRVLNLAHTAINGTIPPELGNCKRLRVLNLAHTAINGTIPPQLGQLQLLEELDLSGNYAIDGTIPPELGNCKRLKVLNLARTAINGTIPPQLGQLQLLEHLDLSSNFGLTGEIPPELSGCTKLKHLDLSDIFRIGKLPEWLGHLQDLRFLPLGYWFDDGHKLDRSPFPEWLTNLTKLEKLMLPRCNLTGSVPASLLSLPLLDHLDLSYNQLTGIIGGGGGMYATYVDLSGNSFTGADLKVIVDLYGRADPRRLQQLYMGANNLSGPVPSDMAQFTNISDLNLDANKLEGSISWVANLSRLEFLDLAYNNLSGTIPAELATFPGLQALILGNNTLTGTIPSFPGLMELLDLSFNRLSGPPEIFNGDDINLSNNQLNGSLDHIKDWGSFTTLDLSHNHLEGALPSSIFNSPSLEYLAVSHNNLSGKLPSLPAALRLKSLDVDDNCLEGHIHEYVFPLGLNRLQLSRNKFSGSIPASICNLQELEVLLLAGNNLHGHIPSCITNLTKLNVLDISNNRLSGRLPSNLTKLLAFVNRSRHSEYGDSEYGKSEVELVFKNLLQTFRVSHFGYISENSVHYDPEQLRPVQFDVSSNNLEGPIPAEIGQLLATREMNLSFNKFSGQIPAELGNLDQLESLDLRNNTLVGGIPTQLCQIKQLGTFNVSYNNLSGSIPTCNCMNTKYPDAFVGNTMLCDSIKGCPKRLPSTSIKKEPEARHMLVNGFLKLVNLSGFYLGIVAGFCTGFWGVLFLWK